MENSIYLGLSRQMALKTNMDIIANNVANMNTTGYRAQNLLFDEYISDPKGADDPLSFVIDQGQYQMTQPGSVSYTENPLDIALSGPGFMGVQGPGGEIMYSRAGNLKLDADRALTTAAGFLVSSAGGGGAIEIPQLATEINIDERGFVSDQNGQIGQIMLVEFENVQELEPIGNNLYKTDGATREAANTLVQQGHLENSNVKPIVEMSRMIETLRAFQTVQNLLQTENERLLGAIEKLTGN